MWKSVKIWQSYREFKGGNFFLRHSVYLVQAYECTCFKINFVSNREDGSTVSFIIDDRWWHLKLLALECHHRCWASVKIEDATRSCTKPISSMGRTTFSLEARQTELIWEPGLWGYLGSCTGCRPEWTSGKTAFCRLTEKKYRTSPRQNIHQCHSQHPCTSPTLTPQPGESTP